MVFQFPRSRSARLHQLDCNFVRTFLHDSNHLSRRSPLTLLCIRPFLQRISFVDQSDCTEEHSNYSSWRPFIWGTSLDFECDAGSRPIIIFWTDKSSWFNWEDKRGRWGIWRHPACNLCSNWTYLVIIMWFLVMLFQLEATFGGWKNCAEWSTSTFDASSAIPPSPPNISPTKTMYTLHPSHSTSSDPYRSYIPKC